MENLFMVKKTKKMYTKVEETEIIEQYKDDNYR